MSGTDFITQTQPAGMEVAAASLTTNTQREDQHNDFNELATKENHFIAVNEVDNSDLVSSANVAGSDAIKHLADETFGDEKTFTPSTQPSLLIELSQIIATETAKIDDYLRNNGIPFPSFEPDGHADFPKLPEHIQRSRQEIMRATQELKDLVVGPTESMRWMGWDHNNQLSLRAINQYNIANAFPVGSYASFKEIAAKVDMDEMNLRRFVRHAMTNRIFKEVSPGVVGHTAASRVIAEDKAMQDWLGFSTEDMFPAAAATIDAMKKFPGSQENNECGFQVAFNTKEPMFATLGKDPIRGKRFGGAMASLTGGEGYEVKYFLDNYDMAEINNRGGTFVDIGGSHGFVCVDLAKRYGGMKFVVQDLPKMVCSAPTPPAELADRIKFEGHNFYTPQTVKGADVYFFRWIIHNQSDAYAIKILQNLIPGLKKGAKIVINDHCLPDPGTESLWDEKIIRTMDLVMLTLLNAQERSATEFRKLFAAASPGYKFLGVTRPEGCRMSIIEAVWEGEDCEMPTPADTPLVTPSDSPIEGKGEGDKTLPLPVVKVEEKVEETETMEEKGATEKLMSLNYETLTANVPRITPEGLLETETMEEKGATEKLMSLHYETLTANVPRITPEGLLETETMEEKGATEKLMSLNYETLTANVPRITPEGLLETETMEEKGATEKLLKWKGEILTAKAEDTAKLVDEEVQVADPLA